MTARYTIHGVLAGAYAGRVPKLAVTLTHASLDRGDTAFCGRVKPGNLCDQEEPELTCPTCVRKVARSRYPAAMKRIEVEVIEKADWDESSHPRDEAGRFGFGAGGGAKGSAARELGIPTRVTPGGATVPIPRYSKLNATDKKKVDAIAAKARFGSLQGQDNDRTDFKEFDVGSTLNAVREAYRAGSGGEAPTEKVVAAVNAAHLRFDALGVRNSDRLDFKEHHVEDVREALTTAYLAGKKAR